MATVPLENDPFSMVFDALWKMVDDSAELTRLVKPGNKIRLNSDTMRSPLKENVAVADTPELILMTGGVSKANLYNSSCSSLIQRTYQWLVTTGDLRTTFTLFPVQFALYCAMLEWETTLFNLQWRTKPFVKMARLSTLHEGILNTQLNRGIEGWSSIWDCSVDMIFANSDLKLVNQGL